MLQEKNIAAILWSHFTPDFFWNKQDWEEVEKKYMYLYIIYRNQTNIFNLVSKIIFTMYLYTYPIWAKF